MTPHKAIEHPHEALVNLRKYWTKEKKPEPEVFKVGDHVRLRVDKNTFAKSHVANFSSHVYKIQYVANPKDEFKGHRYRLEGIKNRTFTFNDLIKTSAKQTEQSSRPKRPKDRLQKQVENELRELDASIMKPRTRLQKRNMPLKPKGTFLHVEIPKRKKI
ncbi:hypothetical protein PhCBS80983_g06201 [Powellomyces hirtus]|uniref:Uncharacterized protein n=1 Tax=Powellomyces hirtus TaxID=109895 RepID=A0A507DPS2_9FUNG|nr:hypothetical protein PhCBS80983_g06201 [Powellomyces hirtus]